MVEVISAQEKEMPKKLDALLVHGYWYAREGERVDLSLRSYLACRAAAKIYKGARTKIVLALGKSWGEENPALGELMKQECQNLGILGEDIIFIPEATDTKSEIETFDKLRGERNWKTTAEIAFRRHSRTLFSSQNFSNTHRFKGVEDILRTDHLLVRKTLNRLKYSREELGYFAYEEVKRATQRLGFSMERKEPKEGPVSFLDRLGLPMDRFSVSLIDSLRKIPISI